MKIFAAFYEALSGRQDSNLRPPGPKPGALPGCATPRFLFHFGKETQSKFGIADAKVVLFGDVAKFFDYYFCIAVVLLTLACVLEDEACVAVAYRFMVYLWSVRLTAPFPANSSFAMPSVRLPRGVSYRLRPNTSLRLNSFLRHE